MVSHTLSLGDCRFELLSQDGLFHGLGGCWIGPRQVRSGRLPLQVYTQTFSGHDLDRLELREVVETPDRVTVRLRAVFRPLPVKLMRDHSFDPIDELGDWGGDGLAADSGEGELDLVIEPATDRFNGVAFTGFRYHWEYRSQSMALYHLRERASWELDGDIVGATAISQSSCSDPVTRFGADTTWSTEGILWFLVEKGNQNPIMTHNLPRWASHQAFDYQYKKDGTLIGVYAKVDLIRSIICREAGKPELKVFDKHIFDESLTHSSTPKAILLNREARDEVGQQNLWTWVQETVHRRARAEYGLAEEPLRIRVTHNYWVNWNIDKYYRDLVPAAISVGADAVFIDNALRNDYTEKSIWGNMCCGHAYEVADSVGGPAALKLLVERLGENGIRVDGWTNNDQSYNSPVNRAERDERMWFVRMEDARLKYGGAYTNVFNILDLSNDGARNYHRDCLIKVKEQTGMSAYLYDSFYNLGFMPVSYGGMRPHTHWRQCLQFLKECQDAGIHFMIESGGPFGEVQHGHPKSYNLENLFACYKINMGSGYTTVPTGQEEVRHHPWNEPDHYRILAYMAKPAYPLFMGGKRIDHLLSATHRRHIRDFLAVREAMGTRYLQPGDGAVIWHDAAGRTATVFALRAGELRTRGRVRCVTSGQDLPAAAAYALQAEHTYQVTDAPDGLPTTL